MPFIIPNQTTTALQRPTPTQSGWTRPADWITITDTPGEVQFLMSDITAPAIAILGDVSGGSFFWVDWGDGSSPTQYSTGSYAKKVFTSGGTPSVLGYNMWKIRVYCVDAGASLSNTKIVNNVDYFSLQGNSIGLLEAVYGDGTQSVGFFSLFNGTSSPVPYVPWMFQLQYVKLPASCSAAGNIFDYTFQNCYGLRKVVMPVSAPNNTQYVETFRACYSLSEPLVLPQDNTTAITGSFSSCFANCSSITSITLPPSLPNVSNMPSAFNVCSSLTTIDVPATPNCLNYNGMFANCRNLQSYEFKSFNITAVGNINIGSMFQNCPALSYIKLPSTFPVGKIVDMANMFAACGSLDSVVFPSNMDATTMSAAFQNCYSLASVVLPTSMPSLTTLATTFQNCANLQSITLPTSVASTITLATTFQNCQSLTEITIPSSYNITTLTQTFQNCYNLRTCNLPNNAQNGITTMLNTFNGCINLRNVVMPTSMNGLTSLQFTFQNCSNLKSIIFPSTLNTCSAVNGTFQNCYNLQSITMPTSMSSAGNWASTFANCSSLKTLTMPATILNSSTAFGNLFQGCVSLTNLVMPTTQTTNTTATGISGMLAQTYSLTGITNLDKIGNNSTGAIVYLAGGGQNTNAPTLDFTCKFSNFTNVGGNLPGELLRTTSIRLRNNGAGQYAGASPQISIAYNSLGQAALVQLFNDLPTITSKTINITANPGAALLTAGERAIATGKGWTIIG